MSEDVDNFEGKKGKRRKDELKGRAGRENGDISGWQNVRERDGKERQGGVSQRR